MSREIENIIEPKRRNLLDVKELWEYRELFYFFAWRDIKVKYKQTTLGMIWVLLQPLATVTIFSLFFGTALNVPSLGLPYPVFVFSGLLLWNFFSTSVNNAGNTMISHGPIIKKIYFPRLIVPISSVLVTLIDFFIAFILFILLIFIYHVPIQLEEVVWYWSLALVFGFIGTIGVVCWLSALTVKYRDFRYVIPFALQIALFLSPVIYPVSIIKNNFLNTFFALNPMYGAISLFRAPLVDASVDWNLIRISLLSSVILFGLGVYYFKRTESYFADIA
jgi:lipopolysaccharide transport system permease protein